MLEITSLRPVAAGNSWLLKTEVGAAVYDTGFACTAAEAVHMLRPRLNGQPLSFILLSHSHYDHASGTGIFAAAFPEAEVCAGAHAAHVFTRPGARKTMRELNAVAAEQYGRSPDDASIDSLAVDRILRDGDQVSLGDCVLEVWETPGHTKCSLSFWCPAEGLLLGSETMGIPSGPIPEDENFLVVPSCMTGVENALRAIERALEARPEQVLIPHTGLVTGSKALRYLQAAHRGAEAGRDMVLRGARDGKSEKELVLEWKQRFYTPETARIQPEAAFDLNAGYIIPAILKEYGL